MLLYKQRHSQEKCFYNKEVVTMKKITLLAIAVAFLSLFSLSFASSSFANTQQSTQMEFVQTAHEGKLEAIPGKSGQYKITLYKPDAYVSDFSDRPKRVTGIIPIKRFVQLWDKKTIHNNFAVSPPNAAIETITVNMIFNKHHLSLLASLSDPKYDAKSDTIKYTLSSLSSRDPKIKKTKLGFTVLFIDGLGIHWGGGGF